MAAQCSAVIKLREEFKANVERSVEYRHGVLRALYDAQTAQEQAVKKTNTLNGVGFDKIDADKLTGIAERLSTGELLEEEEEAVLRERLPKYWGQFLRLQDLHELPAVGLRLVKFAAQDGSDLKEAA